MTLLQELGIIEVVVQDLAAFAAGQPIATTIGGYNASVVHLPSGPTAEYQAITGSLVSILTLVLMDYVAFSSGAPVSIAIKEGSTWYGLTLTKPTSLGAPALAAVV